MVVWNLIDCFERFFTRIGQVEEGSKTRDEPRQGVGVIGGDNRRIRPVDGQVGGCTARRVHRLSTELLELHIVPYTASWFKTTENILREFSGDLHNGHEYDEAKESLIIVTTWPCQEVNYGV